MHRRLAFVVIGLVVVAAAGCSTPDTASGTLEQGKQETVKLVLAAAQSLPHTVNFKPPTEVGAQSCQKTVAGYVVGKTGAHRAQAPLLVYTPANESVSSLYAAIEDRWKAAGYEIDNSRIHETRFPQIRANAPGGYEIWVTALTTPFVVKEAGEQYTDYQRRAQAAGVAPVTIEDWNSVPVGRTLPKAVIAAQLDVYSVSPCLRSS